MTLLVISWISLGLAFACALLIALHEAAHPQKMWIMNAVWPITALYFGPFALWAYLSIGRTLSANHSGPMHHPSPGTDMPQNTEPPRSPTWRQIAIADSHCGAGCTLGDIAVETLIFRLSLTILGSKLLASYVWDLPAAWIFGIAFQYFTIKPMRRLSSKEALWAAIKSDTFSVLAFQVGMYSWMALMHFQLFATHPVAANSPIYWFMMQIAMICGFITSYPANWLLIRSGVKEAMG